METNIIFLDIDGVLCLHKEIDKKCLQHLKTIVDATSARIVLSSSWRYSMCFDHFVLLILELNVLFRFFPKSRAQVEASFKEIGIDSLLGWTGSQGKSRVDEIYHWLKKFDTKTIPEDITVRKWIAIDDMDLLKLDENRMHDHFVLTMTLGGITEETVKEAILLLS